MKRMRRLVMVSVLSLVLGLTGCAGRQQPEKAPEPKEEKGEKGGDSLEEEDPIVEGATKMRTELAGLKEALEAGDANKIQDRARAVDESWERFERKVESKDPGMYALVETSHHIVLAGVQVVPLPVTVIMAEIDRLDRRLEELKQTKGERQAPQKVDIRTGTAAMRQGLAELKVAVDKGDTAEMQQKVKLADQSWAQFKAEVKEKHREAYASIEDSFHTLLAKVEAWPVDKGALNQLIDKVDKQVAQLLE